MFELVGERYQAAVSQLALARLAANAGAQVHLRPPLSLRGAGVPGARRARAISRKCTRPWPAAPTAGTGEYVGSPADADDALVKRLVDAAVLPDLLARELATAMLEAVGADMAVVFVAAAGRRHPRDRRTPVPTRTAPAALRGWPCTGAAYGPGVLLLEASRSRPRRPALGGGRLVAAGRASR